MTTNRSKNTAALILSVAIIVSGCTSMIAEQIPEERQEQGSHILEQVNCLDKSITVENYDSETAAIQNTGDETIDDVQLEWSFEDQETVNRTISNLEPGAANTASTNTAGDLTNFDSSIVECIWK